MNHLKEQNHMDRFIPRNANSWNELEKRNKQETEDALGITFHDAEMMSVFNAIDTVNTEDRPA